MNTLRFWRDTLGLSAFLLLIYAFIYIAGAVMQG